MCGRDQCPLGCRPDRNGDQAARVYRLDGLDGFESADLALGGASEDDARHDARLWIDVVVPSPATTAGLPVRGVVAIQVFNSHPERPLERFAEFELRIIARYHDFMAAARWQYVGLCTLRADPATAVPWTRAEPYVIDAATLDEARRLDESTSPEPPDIVEIYAECRSYKDDKAPRGWLWLVPQRS